MVGRMPSRKAPAIISVDAKICLRKSFQLRELKYLLRSPRLERDKSWGLYIGGEGIIELLGYYGSAFAAADSVYMQSTGWDGWDQRKRIDAPETLLLWSRKVVK